MLRFISSDKKLRRLLDDAKLDIEIIKVLILRTTYPWSGILKENAEQQIKECFKNSELTRNDKSKQEHFMNLGWYLSVVDRISGYALGNFSKAYGDGKNECTRTSMETIINCKKFCGIF